MLIFWLNLGSDLDIFSVRKYQVDANDGDQVPAAQQSTKWAEIKAETEEKKQDWPGYCNRMRIEHGTPEQAFKSVLRSEVLSSLQYLFVSARGLIYDRQPLS